MGREGWVMGREGRVIWGTGGWARLCAEGAFFGGGGAANAPITNGL